MHARQSSADPPLALMALAQRMSAANAATRGTIAISNAVGAARNRATEQPQVERHESREAREPDEDESRPRLTSRRRGRGERADPKEPVADHTRPTPMARSAEAVPQSRNSCGPRRALSRRRRARRST